MRWFVLREGVLRYYSSPRFGIVLHSCLPFAMCHADSAPQADLLISPSHCALPGMEAEAAAATDSLDASIEALEETTSFAAALGTQDTQPKGSAEAADTPDGYEKIT